MELSIFIINKYENTIDKVSIFESGELIKIKPCEVDKYINTKNNAVLLANGFQIMRFFDAIRISDKYRHRIISNRQQLSGLSVEWIPMNILYLDYKWYH